MPDNGGEVALQISTNERWTASSDADWYMITPANGEGSAVCVVKADSSYMYTQREGLITFRTVSGEYTVKIQQGGYERAIKFESLQDDTLHVPHYKPLDEAYVDIEATANVSYKVVIRKQPANGYISRTKTAQSTRKSLMRKLPFHANKSASLLPRPISNGIANVEPICNISKPDVLTALYQK